MDCAAVLGRECHCPKCDYARQHNDKPPEGRMALITPQLEKLAKRNNGCRNNGGRRKQYRLPLVRR